MDNYISLLLSDLAMEKDLSLEDIRYILKDDVIFHFYKQGVEHEIYIYDSVSALGCDADNETRDEYESDKEFGEFLCSTAEYWKLPSGKVLWVSES